MASPPCRPVRGAFEQMVPLVSTRPLAPGASCLADAGVGEPPITALVPPQSAPHSPPRPRGHRAPARTPASAATQPEPLGRSRWAGRWAVGAAVEGCVRARGAGGPHFGGGGSVTSVPLSLNSGGVGARSSRHREPAPAHRTHPVRCLRPSESMRSPSCLRVCSRLPGRPRPPPGSEGRPRAPGEPGLWSDLIRAPGGQPTADSPLPKTRGAWRCSLLAGKPVRSCRPCGHAAV